MANGFIDIESFFEELRQHLVEMDYNIISNTGRSLIAEKNDQSSIKQHKIVAVPFLGKSLVLQKTLVYLNDQSNTQFGIFDPNSTIDNFLEFVKAQPDSGVEGE